MATHSRNLGRKARIMAEAMFETDKAVAKRYGINQSIISRWRKELDGDDEFALAVQEKVAALDSEWAAEVPLALRKAVEFLGRAADSADPTQYQNIRAIAGAFKLVNEGAIAKAVIDARLVDEAGEEDQPDRREAAEEEERPTVN